MRFILIFIAATSCNFTYKSTSLTQQINIDSLTFAFITGARMDVNNKAFYHSSYYKKGYPPAHIGVCTDVVWRAFKHIGIFLKDSLDKDIKFNTTTYGLTKKKIDPNIDFRRVKNLQIYFKRKFKSKSITTDSASLSSWKAGQIVTFKNPDHVAILSPLRNKNGAPLLIHNQGPWAREADDLATWAPTITGRFEVNWLQKN